ncbi:MAG: hypothetical protein NTU80_01340 [Verrucomicrobia bacterium]|nr:hypothetical protein [Verrucomicrobiota bacterium]
MSNAVYAVVSEKGVLRVLRVPVSHANDRFLILAAPYPMPNGSSKRILNRQEPIIPDTPQNAIRFYLAFLRNQRAEHELMMQILDKRIQGGEALMAAQAEATPEDGEAGPNVSTGIST